MDDQVCLDLYVEEKRAKVRVKLWGSCGQDRFQCLAPLYFRDADAIVIFVDMSKEI